MQSTYGTELIARDKVLPGMLVVHRQKTWVASVNNGRHLYLRGLATSARIADQMVEVKLDGKGSPAFSR